MLNSSSAGELLGTWYPSAKIKVKVYQRKLSTAKICRASWQNTTGLIKSENQCKSISFLTLKS